MTGNSSGTTSKQHKEHFRIVFVGDNETGKRDVRRALVQMAYHRKYGNTTENRAQQIDASGIIWGDALLSLFCVDSEKEFYKIITMDTFTHIDIFIVCYNIMYHSQLQMVHNLWMPLIRRHYPNTAIMFCACGIEQRMDRNKRLEYLNANINGKEMDMEVSRESFTNYQSLMTTKVGHSMNAQYRTAGFVEVSATTFQGISVFLDKIVEVGSSSYSCKRDFARNQDGRPKPDDVCNIS